MIDSTFAGFRGKLEKALVLFVLLFSIGFSYSQNGVQLVLVEKADLPNTSSEQFYTLEVKNTTSSLQVIDLKAQNVTCKNERLSDTDLDYEILDMKKQALNRINLSPGKSMTFLLRTERNAQTTLNSYSCIEVIASPTVTTFVNPVSVIVKLLIPDPKSFE